MSSSQVLITSDDLHAVVSICAIVLLVVGIISTFGRMFTKAIVVRRLNLDDYAICLALVSGKLPDVGSNYAEQSFSFSPLGKQQPFCWLLDMDLAGTGIPFLVMNAKCLRKCVHGLRSLFQAPRTNIVYNPRLSMLPSFSTFRPLR